MLDKPLSAGTCVDARDERITLTPMMLLSSLSSYYLHKRLSAPNSLHGSLYLCLSFLSFVYFAMPGHKHTHSVTQNRKAELANAYNELGKELSSSKIRVVGNYTLGRVIGEGVLVLPWCSCLSFKQSTRRLWQSQVRHTPFNFYPGRYQADSKSHVCLLDTRDPSPPPTASPPYHTNVRGHRYGITYLDSYRAMLRW
jgi:hypothetical protein